VTLDGLPVACGTGEGNWVVGRVLALIFAVPFLGCPYAQVRLSCTKRSYCSILGDSDVISSYQYLSPP